MEIVMKEKGNLILGITDENSERSSTMSIDLKVVLIHI